MTCVKRWGRGSMDSSTIAVLLQRLLSRSSGLNLFFFFPSISSVPFFIWYSPQSCHLLSTTRTTIEHQPQPQHPPIIAEHPRCLAQR